MKASRTIWQKWDSSQRPLGYKSSAATLFHHAATLLTHFFGQGVTIVRLFDKCKLEVQRVILLFGQF